MSVLFSIPQPGRRTLRNLLLTALLPAGQTLYIWGGGWNETDTCAGTEAVSIGQSPAWYDFFCTQTAAYDPAPFRFQIHLGLDCSGYLGWVLYNVLHDRDGLPGYVVPSTQAAAHFAGLGWGVFRPAEQVTDWQPGDLMSMPGHVWLSLGTCADQSVLLLHSSPPGVSLCGIPSPDASPDAPVQAVRLAEAGMRRIAPVWCHRYRSFQKPASYLTQSAQMRWNPSFLPDPDGLAVLPPHRLLERLGVLPENGVSCFSIENQVH